MLAMVNQTKVKAQSVLMCNEFLLWLDYSILLAFGELSIKILPAT